MANVFSLLEAIGNKGTKKLNEASKLGSRTRSKHTVCHIDDYEGWTRYYNTKELATLKKLAK